MENKEKDQSFTTTNDVISKKNFTELTELPKFMLTWVDYQSNNIVAVWNQNRDMVFISKSVKPLLGHHPSDLLGESWRDFIPSKDLEHIKEHFETGQDKSDSKEFTISICNKLGKYVWYECNIEKISEENANEFYFIGAFKDISIKKEAEEMLTKSEKMSIAGQLAAGIAHEIRNPLTSIKGFLQLLQAGVTEKEAYYKIMADEIDKIEAITSELLFISRPLTENRNVESINSMLEDVMILLRSQAKLKNITLQKIETEEYFIHCDRSKIKQVLINLIKNAIEATEPSGTIKIAIIAGESDIKMNIMDEGPKIPEEVIHKIGEPFFTTKKGGTGLGLMISKQILEQHNAKMEIFQNATKGNTFRIILPKRTE